MPELGPTVTRRVEVSVNRKVPGIALMRRSPGQFDRRNQPGLGKARCATAIPELEGTQEVVGRHEGVAAQMETDAVRSQAHCRSFDLQEQRVRGADELDKKGAALA